MPDENKPDESLDERVQPNSEEAAVNAVADQNEAAGATGEEAELPMGDAADTPDPEQIKESHSDIEKPGGEVQAEEPLSKMFDEDNKRNPEETSVSDPGDEFPDLSQVKMEETIASPAEFQQLGPSPVTPGRSHNIDLLLDVKMPVSIELGRTELPISEILNLGPGSVVELDKLAGEPVDLLVNDKIIAKGEVVVVDENFGVRITMLMSPEERLKSMAQQ
jgi:flagellar motor switch protein FliN/FliY